MSVSSTFFLSKTGATIKRARAGAGESPGVAVLGLRVKTSKLLSDGWMGVGDVRLKMCRMLDAFADAMLCDQPIALAGRSLSGQKMDIR